MSVPAFASNPSLQIFKPKKLAAQFENRKESIFHTHQSLFNRYSVAIQSLFQELFLEPWQVQRSRGSSKNKLNIFQTLIKAF
jgi:hypothetical protein